MALTALPPAISLYMDNMDYDAMQDDLDDDISNIRAQIQELTQRRRLISSTLLGSNKIQKELNAASAAKKGDHSIAPVFTESQLDLQENIHRLALSVTSFPYIDPSPETSDVPLLGIRIDICSRAGKYNAPYYLHLKRKRQNDNATELDELSVYRHTIPSHIPVRDYEARYLPQRDEGYGSEVSNETSHSNRQDLHTFVRNVRKDLVSWTLRREAIEILAENLGLVPESTEALDADGSEAYVSFVAPVDTVNESGFKAVAATTVEARFVRVVWVDGRLARAKISDKGFVERAIVFGDVDGQETRMKATENVLVGDGLVRLEELAERLRRC